MDDDHARELLREAVGCGRSGRDLQMQLPERRWIRLKMDVCLFIIILACRFFGLLSPLSRMQSYAHCGLEETAGVVVVLQDMTDYRAMQESVQRTGRVNDFLVNTLPVSTVVTDHQVRLLTMSFYV